MDLKNLNNIRKLKNREKTFNFKISIVSSGMLIRRQIDLPT